MKSTKATVLIKELSTSLHKGDELREFVVDDYLVLYLVHRHHVIFLAVKHHRQLSFDLKQFWCKKQHGVIDLGPEVGAAGGQIIVKG